MMRKSPGNDCIVSADDKQDEIGTKRDHHSRPVRVAHQLYPERDREDFDLHHDIDDDDVDLVTEG